MMIRLHVCAVLALVILPGLIGDAIGNVGPNCLVLPLPSEPLKPTFTFESKGSLSSDGLKFDVWRQPCTDGSRQSAILVRVTPAGTQGYICSYSSSWAAVQDGVQIELEGWLNPHGGVSLCGGFTEPITLFLTAALYGETEILDESGPFTLFYLTSGGVAQVSIPSGVVRVSLVSTGCNPCSVGQTAAFHLRVVNPGDPEAVELKTGIRFPNNGPRMTLLGTHADEVLKSGEFDIPLASLVVPSDIPNGTYVIEAAILDPIFGVTLSRDAITAVKQ